MGPTGKYTFFGALVAGAAAVYAAPYITVWRMRDAVERGDGAALSAHVDFASLRQSLKAQLSASLMKRAPDTSGVGAAQLGALLMEAAASKMIQDLVTPEAVATLLRGQDPTSNAPPALLNEATMQMGYEGLARFVVTVAHARVPSSVALVFTRDGLGWKLSAARLPVAEEKVESTRSETLAPAA